MFAVGMQTCETDFGYLGSTLFRWFYEVEAQYPVSGFEHTANHVVLDNEYLVKQRVNNF